MAIEIVEKVMAAASPGGDPLEYIMSDDSVDRLGDVIEQDGWKLVNFKKNPIALFGHDSSFPVGTWRDVAVKGNQLRGRLELMAAVTPRLQEIHAAVNGNVLRAVSVGFKPLKAEPIEGSKVYGMRFLESELVECSLVAVPANPNAIQVARSLNISRDTMNLIFGESADKDKGIIRRETIGKPAGTHRSIRNTTMSLSEQIEQFQTRVTDLKDKIVAHSSHDFGDDVPDEQHLTVGEELNRRLVNEQRHLDMLKTSEAALGAKSEPLTTGSGATPVATRRPFAVPKKEIAPADYVFRGLVGALLSHVTHRPIPDIIRERYGDDEATFKVAEATVLRAATVPATTTMAGWAAELVQTAVGDFIDSLMPASVYPPLSARGGRFTFGRNGTVSLPTRQATPTLAGAFVAEGAAIPVRQGAFTSVTLTPRKMAVISTFTRQIAEHSTPAIEQQIRTMMQDDTAISLDTVLLDATAGSALRPPGLRNGVSGLTPTAGGGFNALVGDIKQMVGVLAAANSLRAPVWIMNPVDVLSLTLTQNAGGDFPFQTEANQNRLQGYPIITSTTQTPKTVILLDAADFFSATGDEPQFSVSDQATLHMEDTAPTAIGTPGTPPVVAAPVRSLWQTDSIGLRMMLDISWAMRRTGVVTWVAGITW